MKFTVQSDKNYTIFEVEGSLTIENLVNLENILKPEVDQKKNILLELSEVGYIDSSSIRFIIHYFNETLQNGRCFCLVNVNSEIAQMFSITELDKKIKIFDSVDQALETILNK